MNETLAWIAIWSTLLCSVQWLGGRWLTYQLPKILFFPGFLLEALLRLVACLATASPARRFSPVRSGRPFLETGPSPYGVYGLTASVLVRGILLFVAGHALLSPFPEFVDSNFALPFVDYETLTSGSVHWHSVVEFGHRLRELPGLLEFESFLEFFCLYTLFGCLLASGIGRREWIGVLIVLAGTMALIAAGAWLGVQFGFLSRGWFIRAIYVPQLWSTFSLMITLTMVHVIGLALLRSLHMVTRGMTGSKSSGEARATATRR